MRVLYFFKEHSYDITKIFIYQIGMTVFGSSIAMAAQANPTVLLVTGIFSCFFFLYLVYSAMWEIGAKDHIRIEAGRLIPRPRLGLCIASAAGIPNYIFLLLTLIGFIFGSSATGLEYDWAAGLFAVSQMIFKLLNGMYIAIISLLLPHLTDAENTLASYANIILCAVTVFPSLIVAEAGYYIGSNGKTLRALIGIKTK